MTDPLDDLPPDEAAIAAAEIQRQVADLQHQPTRGGTDAEKEPPLAPLVADDGTHWARKDGYWVRTDGDGEEPPVVDAGTVAREHGHVHVDHDAKEQQ